ncbi:hypothetical protein SDC9_103219 [bioreactor metagenome]|uniref:Uncharacterized protein n=1 Tax=bioreactor metagenome TaxID=1076179 RepID=A0A645AU53_9ZZZZ
MSHCINTICQSAYYGHSLQIEPGNQLLSHFPAINRRFAGANNRRHESGFHRHRTFVKQKQGRIETMFQARRVFIVEGTETLNFMLSDKFNFFFSNTESLRTIFEYHPDCFWRNSVDFSDFFRLHAENLRSIAGNVNESPCQHIADLRNAFESN